MASGGGDPPSGKKDDLKRDDPDFLHEQMLLTGIYGEEEEEEKLVFICINIFATTKLKLNFSILNTFGQTTKISIFTSTLAEKNFQRRRPNSDSNNNCTHVTK